MGKTHISARVDQEIADKLKGKNKSEKINKILKQYFDHNGYLNEEIKYHQRQIELLQLQKEEVKKQQITKLKNIPSNMKKRLESAAEALNNHPTKQEEFIIVWQGIINREYNQNYNLDEFEKLLLKWTKWKK